MNQDVLRLQTVYGARAQKEKERYAQLEKNFRLRFDGAKPESFFSAPGRTEIIGNHVDHNHGKVIAASITLDTICACKKAADTDRIRIFSEGYHEPVDLRLSALASVPKEEGSLSLVAGLMDGLQKEGYPCHGFDAYVSSDIASGSGLSSSASYEILLATLVSHLFYDGLIPMEACARAGQYAENHWWNKASGLMDQMACAHGGTVLFDFSDGVSTTPLDFTFDDIGCDLVLVNSGHGHADLSAEYSAIPDEMRLVASALGKQHLNETTQDDILSLIPSRSVTVGSDRALLRALHYHAECARVEEAVRVMTAGEKERLLPLITASGNSSWKWLQSCYVTGETKEQPVAVMLALTELFLAEQGRGVCRINGGGFGGVLMCVLPKEDTASYIDYMTPFAGREQIHVMGIRREGACRIEQK